MINKKCNTCDNLDSNANGLYCQILIGGCSKEERGNNMRSTQWNNVKTNVRTNIDIGGNNLLMTENQWLKRGYVPISEEAGKILWANQFCQGSFRYLFKDEVIPKILADAKIEPEQQEKTIPKDFYEKRFNRID